MLKQLLTKYLQGQLRKSGPIILADLKREKPIDDSMGFGRGTPIDRFYIEKFIRTHRDLIKGDVLEVMDSTYTDQFGSAHLYPSILNFQASVTDKNIIPGDLTQPSSIQKDRYDCFICTQTYNFIYDFKTAIQSSCQLLKPGGTLLATVSGLCQVSRYDMDRWGDYWRFTNRSIEQVFAENFEGEVELELFGNLIAATALLQGAALEDIDDISRLNQMDDDYQVIIGIKATKRAK